MNFKISDKDGFKYSKISGDNNKIHLDELTGYNSIFGEKICHGCLVILKTFKVINLKKILKNCDNFSIKVSFFKHFTYNSKISVVKRDKTYKLYQEKNNQLAEIVIKYLNDLKYKDFGKKKCSLKINKKFLNYYNNQNKFGTLSLALNNLTKYVGTIYPGENSIINKININFGRSFNFSENKTNIYTKKTDKRIPTINNKLTYNNFIVEFETLKRPNVKRQKIRPSEILIQKVNKIKENALIIGASQGIGRDVLDILKYNKKILKIATFNKNSINLNENKIIKKKIEINKDIKKINKIVSKYSPVKIYYFPSPKIFFSNKLNTRIKDKYKKIFIQIPLEIIKNNKRKKISFFYPSTTNIDHNKHSVYSKIKLKAESKIKKICLKYNIPITIFRFPAINSRQSISLLNTKLPNLTQYIKSNRYVINKIFSSINNSNS